jgi:flagellar hook-basal body complex protein FliE
MAEQQQTTPDPIVLGKLFTALDDYNNSNGKTDIQAKAALDIYITSQTLHKKGEAPSQEKIDAFSKKPMAEKIAYVNLVIQKMNDEQKQSDKSTTTETATVPDPAQPQNPTLPVTVSPQPTGGGTLTEPPPTPTTTAVAPEQKSPLAALESKFPSAVNGIEPKQLAEYVYKLAEKISKMGYPGLATVEAVLNNPKILENSMKEAIRVANIGSTKMPKSNTAFGEYLKKLTESITNSPAKSATSTIIPSATIPGGPQAKVSTLGQVGIW